MKTDVGLFWGIFIRVGFSLTAFRKGAAMGVLSVGENLIGFSESRISPGLSINLFYDFGDLFAANDDLRDLAKVLDRISWKITRFMKEDPSDPVKRI